MSNILILGNLSDGQTGLYLLEACKSVSSNVAAIDIRAIANEINYPESQTVILDEVKALKMMPELIIVMKGLEMDYDTLLGIKNRCPKATIVNWFFDKFLGPKPIWEQTQYFDTLRFYDYYFCSLKGVSDKLQSMGFKNAIYLDEACSPSFHACSYYNHFQEQKYGEDISFVGSLGFTNMHTKRIEILQHIIKEGLHIKIWGDMLGDAKSIPLEIRHAHTGFKAINDAHSMIANASLINLGIDQDDKLELGYSARLHRVLCAEGLYLTNYVPKLETVFKINLKGEPITDKQDLVVYYDNSDMIEKIDFLLSNESLRKQIAKNGKETILKNHTFEMRIKEMLKVIENGKKEEKENLRIVGGE